MPKEDDSVPLWQIYHPVDAYSGRDMQDFARDITAFYANVGLPRFYVVVLFRKIDRESFHVGGEPTASTVRIVITHIARSVSDPEHRRRTAEAFRDLSSPYTTIRGLTPEFHVDESPPDQWMINGIVPPPGGSDAEKAWASANLPLPY